MVRSSSTVHFQSIHNLSTLSLHDALPIFDGIEITYLNLIVEETFFRMLRHREFDIAEMSLSSYTMSLRSEEHTSELQSLTNLVCRLLLEKKKTLFMGRSRATVQFQ